MKTTQTIYWNKIQSENDMPNYEGNFWWVNKIGNDSCLKYYEPSVQLESFRKMHKYWADFKNPKAPK